MLTLDLLERGPRETMRAFLAVPRVAPRRPRLNVDLAVRHLNLRNPVDIQWDSFYDGGRYECDLYASQDIHRIFICDTMNDDWLSACLWHELTHAAQVERSGLGPFPWAETQHDAFMAAQCAPSPHIDFDGFMDAYLNIPCEPEAFANMRLHFDVGPIGAV